jgi:Flp pilus assembly protein TadD
MKETALDGKAPGERGIAYHHAGDYTRAIADFTAALKTDRHNAALYNLRGSAYYQKEDYKRAEADYNEAVRLDPKFAAAYKNLIILYQELGEKAVKLMEEYRRKAAECTGLRKKNKTDDPDFLCDAQLHDGVWSRGWPGVGGMIGRQ